MIMQWVQIDREVVVLYSEDVDGKVILGKMTVLPVGVFQKLQERQHLNSSTTNNQQP